jgi:hypothetical protein
VRVVDDGWEMGGGFIDTQRRGIRHVVIKLRARLCLCTTTLVSQLRMTRFSAFEL